MRTVIFEPGRPSRVMSDFSEESSASESEAGDGEESRNLPEGAPRISSGVHIEGGYEEELRNEERELIANSGSKFRQFAFNLVESRWFSFSILAVIMLNTLFIAIQTSKYVVAKAEWYLMLIDQVFLAIYIVELSLKLYVWRFKFFKQFWNNFDAAIVASSLIDFLIPLIVQNIGVFDAGVFRVLRVFRAIRALRALRVLRTIRFLKNLQIIVTTVLQSIPALGSIVMLISLVLYIFAIIGRGLYGEVDPDRFGNLARACFTLFQLITLDDWFFVYSTIRDEHPEHGHILLYLVLFIILETFIFINLFVAVIVDNLARTQAAANAAKPKKIPGLHKKTEVVHESDHDVTGHHQGRSGRSEDTTHQTRSQKTAKDYYNTDQLSHGELELMERYLQLLASLEQHNFTAQSHARVLEELVDLVDFSKT